MKAELPRLFRNVVTALRYTPAVPVSAPKLSLSVPTANCITGGKNLTSPALVFVLQPDSAPTQNSIARAMRSLCIVVEFLSSIAASSGGDLCDRPREESLVLGCQVEHVD